jgi:hypothetical protein
MVSESREVHSFQRVRMQDFGVLEIVQGQRESLVVEADGDVLPKVYTQVRDNLLILRLGRDWRERLGLGLHTSLTRPRIRYKLTVKDLHELVVAGFGRVKVGQLRSDHFALQLSGSGEITLHSLTADCLTVELAGAGRIQMAGKVHEQDVSLSGVGCYEASKLTTQRTSIQLRGAASATVWAHDLLNIDISGLGSVDHIGNPKITRRIHGPGAIRIPRPPVPRPWAL